MLKKSAKTAALFTIAILLMGGILGAALGQVQGAEKVTFSFTVLGNGQVPATGVKVDLEGANGAILASNTSSPVVKFQTYPGNYIIYIPSQYVSGVVYSVYENSISVAANGTAYSGAAVFSAADVNYVAANSYVYVTVKGVTQINSVYLTLPNGLNLQAAKVNASNPNSGFSVNTIPGNQVVNVEYSTTSTAVYTMSIDPSSNANTSVIANVTASQNLFGTVKSSSTGNYLETVGVSIYQNGTLLASDEFTNGYYFLSLPAGTYSLVISSPGYLPKEISVTASSGGSPSFQSVSLTSSKVVQTQSISFDSNFQTLTVTGGITLTNATVLPYMPYSTAGSLYNQMKLAGLSKGQLWSILNTTVPYSTVYTVLYNNYSYNSTGSQTTTLTTGTGNGVLYQFNYTSIYSQSKVKAQNNSIIQLYVTKNNNNTSAISYVSELSIPSTYQRANIINSSVADVSGYSGTITVKNSSFNGFLTIKIAPKAKPTLNMNQISATWNGSFESTISSNTASNFTLLVPVGKEVTLNASGIPFDNVLKTDNYQAMNFTWKFGSTSTEYGYNITDNFTSGSYPVSLIVTSSGGVANSSNFTIIGDSQNPLFNLDVLQSGRVLENISTSSSASYKLWVNQTQTVYFNAIRSQDLLPSGQKTGLPLSMSWNISGSKETGTNISYSFTTPTFNSTLLYANVMVKNGVGNSFNVSFSIHVNDTTPPVATFQIYGASGNVISSAKEGQNITLNASKSYAPDGGHIVRYNWSFTFSNGTVAVANKDYKVYSSSSNNSTLTMAFLQYGTFSIELKVTDQSNNTRTNTLSLVVNAVRPEVEIMNITYPKSYMEGTSSVLKIVLKNVGLETASTYYVTVKIGGKVVKNETFTNLSSNSTQNASITFVPPSSGTYSMTVSVHAVNQPSFFNTNITVTKAISVSQAAWKLPALVGGIVVAIGVLSFIYYDVTVRRKRPKELKQPKKQLKV
jgi:hypothetical protein